MYVCILVWKHLIHIKPTEKIFTCCALTIPYCTCHDGKWNNFCCFLIYVNLCCLIPFVEMSKPFRPIWLGPNSFWKFMLPETIPNNPEYEYMVTKILSVCMCTMLAPQWLDGFYSYWIFWSLSIIGPSLVSIKILVRKLGPFALASNYKIVIFAKTALMILIRTKFIMPKRRMIAVYLHSPIRLQGMVHH
jgi:hypothetical protein